MLNPEFDSDQMFELSNVVHEADWTEGIKCLLEIGDRKEAIKISILMDDVM